MHERLGRYHLLKPLATGGMGEVFLARQVGPAGFAKVVVVKRILKPLAQDPGFIVGFVNEAQLAAQLQHPNIVQVFGLEHEQGTWFIAMECVHGRSLRELVNLVAARPGTQVPRAVAVHLACQALHGLHFAHQLTDARGRALGILHRDVSPENLLVSFDGVVKLVDFGIARAMTGAVTRVGRPKGKVAYMAPELTVSGSVVDRRADVYGLGVVLYELLRGALPPHVPTSIDAVALPRAAYRRDPELPPALDEVLRRALAPAPEDRWATAQEMSEALEAWLATEGAPVKSRDVVSFLSSLWGRDVVEANPAVIPLEADEAGGPVPKLPLPGTQPLAVAALEPGERGEGLRRLLVVTQPMAPAPGPLAAHPGPSAPRRAQPLAPALVAPAGAGSIHESLAALQAAPAPLAAPPAPLPPSAESMPEERPPALGDDDGPLSAIHAVTRLRQDLGLPAPAKRPPSAPLAAPAAPPTPPRRRWIPVVVLGGASASALAAFLALALWPTAPVVSVAVAGETVAPGRAAPGPDAGEPEELANLAPVPKVNAPTLALPRRRGRGWVVLQAPPGLQVTHLGKPLGVTPLEPVEVAMGTAVFVLRHPRLGTTRRAWVRVTGGEPVVLRADGFPP